MSSSWDSVMVADPTIERWDPTGTSPLVVVRYLADVICSGAINVGAVMDDLAAAVQTVVAAGRTAHAYPAEALVSGDAIVSYPTDPVKVSTTFRRGQDRATFPVLLICGLPQDKTTRDQVTTATGASVINAIESY